MFQPHSTTSRNAFETLADEQGQLDEVLEAFKAARNDGNTCEEAYFWLKENYRHWAVKPYGTVSARMTTLKRNKQLYYTNQSRKTTSGKPAEVWVHPEYATEAHKLFTAEKLQPDKEIALEKIANVERFLEALIKGNATTGPWLSGLKHNIGLIQEAQKLLQ